MRQAECPEGVGIGHLPFPSAETHPTGSIWQILTTTIIRSRLLDPQVGTVCRDPVTDLTERLPVWVEGPTGPALVTRGWPIRVRVMSWRVERFGSLAPLGGPVRTPRLFRCDWRRFVKSRV